MKRFYRPKKGRVIAGVAAGIAQYFNIRVFFVRLVWFLLFLPGGAPGVIPYIILWMVMPSEDKVTHDLRVDTNS
jgi:phage shock protein C